MMNKKSTEVLLELLEAWTPDCDSNCKDCTWGCLPTARSPEYICPLLLTRNMIYTHENVPLDWAYLHG